jgi:predicted heme/steroid binding protein
MKYYSEEYKTYITLDTNGEIYDQVDCYDWEEGVEGYDEEGNYYKGGAMVSCDEIVDITELERV